MRVPGLGQFLLRAIFAPAVLLLVSAQSSPPSGSVSLRIIVLADETTAQQVLTRLLNGEDFAVLAKEKSIEPSASSGGYLGTVDTSTLRRELRDALVGLKPGQISKIVHIGEGYAILKILEPYQVAETGGSAGNVASAGLASAGSIRYTPNVSGIGEAESALFRSPKPPGWAQDLQKICATRKQTWTNAVARLVEFLSPANAAEAAKQAPLDVTQEYYALGELYSYPGEMEQAITEYQKAYQLAQAKSLPVAAQLEQELGVAYLHKAEMENGVYDHPGDRCLIPLARGIAYGKKQDSETAIQYFEKYLQSAPEDLPTKWLLNYAYMTLGGYPSRVPKQYLIPSSVFESQESAPRFRDVAPAAGIVLKSMAGGIIVDDFENNGLLDIVTSSMNMCEHLHYFHNNGDGTFTDRSHEAGLLDQLGGLNIVQADYDNDGCMDILVLRGGWEIPMRKSLLRGHCNGTFSDVTEKAGLAEPATASQTAVWTDINNDGWLDLFVGSENGPAQLFLSNRNGTFTDIARSAGVDRVAFSKAVVSSDYDNDGYPDLYVSNYGGDNFLYHNNRNLTFTDLAKNSGVLGPWISFPSWFFDYDNDGWPDLFVSSYFVSLDESVRTYLGLPPNAATMKLYRNQHDGTFRDVTAETGLNKVLMPMGANFGDIDNDGFLDIYLGNGNPNYASLIPHMLLRNHQGKYFSDVTAATGTGELHKGHGVAFADIDRDGDEDILTVIGGAVPGDAHAFRLFENSGNGNDWINIKLTGVKSNRAALGARIQVTVENAGKGERSIYRTVGSGGSFGASPLEQHIGLGASARILNIEIWWPTSNTRQNFSAVGTDQFIEITEFAKDYRRLHRKRVRLGARIRDAAKQGGKG